jgi:IPT/TIG domain/Carboxypeptidase regulatory-like domain
MPAILRPVVLKAATVCATSFLLTLVVGCGGTGSRGGGTSASIGAAGGTLALNGGPSLEIPAGALPVTTSLTVQQTGETAPSGAQVYRFEPDGTSFAQPVTVTLPLPAGITAPAVYWSKPGSTTAFEVVPATLTASGVQARNTHFSRVFVGPSTGTAVCANAGADSDGTVCGAGRVCIAGACGATVSGTVSGVPVGTTITLTGAASASTTTAASGDYSFGGLATGTYTVTPSASGYVFDPAQLTVTVGSASVAGRDFAAARLHGIAGTVSGVVRAGVTVTLGGASSASTTTDASGNYSFSELLAGSYTVTASLAGYAFTPTSAALDLAGEEATRQDFAAAGAYSITGTVSGPVAAGVTVSLAGTATASTTTDAAGRFTFGALVAGDYSVTPALSGYGFQPASAAVTVTSASVAAPGFVEWKPVLQGVSPSEGHVGASLTLTGSAFGSASPASSVTLSGLPMTIVSWSSTQIVARVPPGAGAGPVQVRVGAADSGTQPFTVTATVAGQLVDASGSTLAGSWAFGGDGSPARLIVTAVGTGRSALATQAPGTPWGGLPQAFSLELPLGTYTLAIDALDGQGNPSVDLLQDASRLVPNLVVGEAGLAALQVPLRWHWEVHELDPGFPICNSEAQLWFRDSLHGYAAFKVDPGLDPAAGAASIHGMVMKTSDGGRTWDVANHDISVGDSDFRPTAGAWFGNGYLLARDSGVVLSIGDNGDLRRSTDDGQTWSPGWLNWATVGPGGVAPTRFAQAGDRLWLSIVTGGVQGSNERSLLVYSDDEGQTWNRRFDVCNPSYYAPNGCGTGGVPLGFAGIDMACSTLNPQHCVTMGYEHDNYTSLVMVTLDGFQTFKTISPRCGSFTGGSVLWFPGTDTAWVIASSSCPGIPTQHIVTSDGGETWTDWAPSPITGRVSFTDADHGVTWWDSGVWMTRDAAASWRFTGHAPAGGAGMRTVHMLDPDHLWALGHPDCRYSSAAYVARWVP